jgi:hypothetical protein
VDKCLFESENTEIGRREIPVVTVSVRNFGLNRFLAMRRTLDAGCDASRYARKLLIPLTIRGKNTE